MRQSEEYFLEKEKMYIKNKNKYLICFFLIFVIGYSLFFTSKIWMPTKKGNMDTHIGEIIEKNGHEVSILSWEYLEKNNEMEIYLYKNNKTADGIENFKYTALDKNKGDIKSKTVYEDNELAVIHLINVPKRWKNISLRIDIKNNINKNTDNFETIKLYKLKENVKKVSDRNAFKFKSEKEYKIRVCNLKTKIIYKKIDNIRKNNSKLNHQLEKCDDKILELEEKAKYMTDEEKLDNTNVIAEIRNEKTAFQTKIFDNQNEIRELENKIIIQKKKKGDLK